MIDYSFSDTCTNLEIGNGQDDSRERVDEHTDDTLIVLVLRVKNGRTSRF